LAKLAWGNKAHWEIGDHWPAKLANWTSLSLSSRLAAWDADITNVANNAKCIFSIFLLRSLRTRNNSPIANSNDYYFIHLIARTVILLKH
jgi:hypothetical protein